jgi:hypothetical protein
MHALIKENKVVKYPYRDSDLRKDNPNVSFPRKITDEVFLEYGAVRVIFSTPPEITHFQRLIEEAPIWSDNRWNQTWVVVDLSKEEAAELTTQKVEEIRAIRNEKLSKTDWSVLPDSPVDDFQVWLDYRQSLRDITTQEGFPWSVSWPEPPQ